MKERVLFIFIFLGLFSSCQEKNEVRIVELELLSESNLYNEDSVYKYILLYKDENQEIANSYLEKVDNEISRNTDKAIYYLKRSISLYPQKETYEKLGSLLLKTGKFEEAYSAFKMIAVKARSYNNGSGVDYYLFDKPNEATYYEYIISCILNFNYLDEYHIGNLKELNFDQDKIKQKIAVDTRLNLDPTSTLYKNIMLQFLNEEELEAYKNSKTNFDNLLQSIKDTNISFEIGNEKVNKFDYRGFIDDGSGPDIFLNITDLFYLYLKEKQENQNAWYNYNFNRRYSLFDSLKTIVYSIDSSETACPKEMRHIYHRLVVYSNQGKIIDDKIIAAQSGDYLATAKVNLDIIEITEYNRKWSKPYTKSDFDNDLLSVNQTSTKSYKITPSGKIEELVQVANTE